MMVNILLACAVGFSTSMLVARMKEATGAYDEDINIISVGETDIENYTGFDILLLGPQIEHRYDDLANSYNVPVVMINSYDYGTMNGKKVLDFVFQVLSNLEEEIQ